MSDLGISFSPFGDAAQAPNAGTRQPTPQDAIAMLSLRYPRSVGAGAPVAQGLLPGAPGAGSAAVGSPNGLDQLLQMLFGPIRRPIPPTMPGMPTTEPVGPRVPFYPDQSPMQANATGLQVPTSPYPEVPDRAPRPAIGWGSGGGFGPGQGSQTPPEPVVDRQFRGPTSRQV